MVDFEQKEQYSISDLLEIIRLLRSENGCPWDKEQTHSSIRSSFIEEVYEAIEAIDLNDTALLREELGDVLLQVVMHCQMETEQSHFQFDDVCDEVCKKLIVRHPHVFGEVQVSGSADVLKNWDTIKQNTKGQSYGDTLADVAKSLPALMRAQKVGKRAARAGMDFHGTDDAFACIEAETAELKEAIAAGDPDRIAEEYGDLLFSCVNTARHLKLDAEQAVTDATEKFICRFQKTEELVEAAGLNMAELPIEQLDLYWANAKELLGKTAR